MSEFNVRQDQSGDSGAAASGCEAPELKVLIERLAAQISVSDERNVAALERIQLQLSNLRAQTRDARRKVPAEIAPALDRLEDAIASLAGRVEATAAQDTNTVTFVGDEPAVASSSADRAVPVQDEAEADEPAVAVVEQVAAAPELNQPPALRSAAVFQVAGARAPVTSAAADPFRFSDETAAGDPENPWDAELAEALTRIYESEGSEFVSLAGLPSDATAVAAVDDRPATIQSPVVQPSHEDVEPSSHVPTTDVSADTTGAVTAAVSDVDRGWLDVRFGEIADQVAKTLAADDAEVSFSEISRRLDDLEDRFETAIGNVASRADVEGISAIEGYLNELAGQFEQSRAELNRVALIEQEVISLADRLSEDRLAQLVSPAAASGPELNVEAIAFQIAEQLASRMPEQRDLHDGGLGPEDFSEIKHLVTGLIDSQRQGGEQTNSMLDTMQQAMIRLLDRMDAIENAQLALVEQARIPSTDLQGLASEHSLDQDGEAHIRRNTARQNAADGSVSDSIPRVRREQASARPAAHKPDEAEEDDDFELSADDAFRSESETASRPAISAAPASADRRQDFIASARRAAQRANERASAAGPSGPESSAPAHRAPVAKAAPGADVEQAPAKSGSSFLGSLNVRQARSSDEDELPVEMDASSGSNRSRLWVAGLALAVLALGAGGYMMRGTISEMPIARQLITPQTMERERKAAEESNSLTDKSRATEAPKSGSSKSATDRELLNRDGTPTGSSNGETDVASAESFPLGIAVERHDRELTIEELTALQNRQRNAQMSTHVGTTLPIATAVPASLMPVAPEATPDSAAPSTAEAGRERQQAMMPPALIGPTSLRMAAANGNPSAEFEVGARFAEGRGVNQDFKQASAWYERSAKQGFALAQYRLATLFERGLGVAVDKNVAKYWYMQAANQGTVKAMHNLAVLTAGQGQGKPDYTTAAAWFLRAAERGLADSQFNLAILHQNGLGVPKDAKQAYKWFSLAAKAGDTEAKTQVAALGGQLEATDKAAIDREIATWRAQPFDSIANDAAAAGGQWQNAASAS